MAAGVGKTFRMLQEARESQREGRDVVIGFVEFHGRPETSAQAAGFETVPRRRVPNRGMVVEEMDLPGVLRRRPEVCLIDELAHTNEPGLEHDKRYEDVEDVLTAGIDVFSTVNVQHLESVSGRVGEITGVPVRETLPDWVVNEADEVIVVNLTPVALLNRIREGKVFPARDVPRALGGFFVPGNLDVLREMALLQVVEEIEARQVPAHLLRQGDRLISGIRPERRERLLALVTPGAGAGPVLRRAWAAARRLDADLDALWAASPAGSADPTAEDGAGELRRLASVLEAELIVDRGGDLPAAVRRVAAERGTTCIVMGSPRPRRGLGRLREPAADAIRRAAPEVELRIVPLPADD